MVGRPILLLVLIVLVNIAMHPVNHQWLRQLLQLFFGFEAGIDKRNARVATV